MHGPSRKVRLAALAAGTVGMIAVAGAPATAGSHNPPGNNGTIKVDDRPFDSAPDNEPHVGCDFQIDFYGFDEGEDLNADVTFTAHPPTGGGETLLTDEVFIGEDPAGGGTDLDASVTYDLSDRLASYEPHDQQGYHVKLTINADGSQGADTKQKVFWIEGCEDESPGDDTSPTTTTPPTTTTIPDSNTGPEDEGDEPDVGVDGETVTPDEETPEVSEPEAQVAGNQIERNVESNDVSSASATEAQVLGAQVERSELARTGSMTDFLTIIGAAMLAFGAFLDRTARRIVH